MFGSILNKLKPYKTYIIYLSVIVLLYLYYVHAYAYRYASVQSDSISPLFMAQDILDGNIFLKDWYGSTSSFFTYIYIYILLPYAVFGMSYEFFYYYPTVFVLIILVSAYLLSYKDLRVDRISYGNIFVLISLFVIFPNTHFGESLFLFSHHNESYAVVLVVLVLINRVYTNNYKHYYLYLIAIAALCFTAMGDSFVLYIFIIPLSILLTGRLLVLTAVKKYDFLLLLGIWAGVLCQWCVRKIVLINGGITYTGFTQASFASFDKIGERIAICFTSVLDLLGANFFGITPLFSALDEVIRFGVFIIICCFFIYMLCTIIKRDIVTQFLISSPIIVLLIYIVSDIPLSDRYFVFVLICFFILLARGGLFSVIKDFSVAKKLSSKGIISFVAVIFSANMFLNFMPIVPKPSEQPPAILDILLENNLTSGYTADKYWLANVMSFYSKGNVELLSVLEGKVNKWMVNTDRYKSHSSFIIVNSKEVDGYIKIYGVPSRVIHVGRVETGKGKYHIVYEDLQILIYDKNIGIFSSQELISGMNSNNCDILENSIRLNKNGVIYGPYEYLADGEYTITIRGDRLHNLSFDAGSFVNGIQFSLRDINITPTEITYKIDIYQNIDMVEFRIFNNSDEPVLINSIKRTGNF